MPAPDLADKDHWIFSEDAEKCAINNKFSHDTLQQFLPDSRKANGEASRIKEEKVADCEFSKILKRIKVQAVVVCANCHAPPPPTAESTQFMRQIVD